MTFITIKNKKSFLSLSKQGSSKNKTKRNNNKKKFKATKKKTEKLKEDISPAQTSVNEIKFI